MNNEVPHDVHIFRTETDEMLCLSMQNRLLIDMRN